jgi:radical SAM superfamily enzyme YgiQ (UPF0313 family)
LITLISNGHPLGEVSVKYLVGYLESFGISVRAIYLNNWHRLWEGMILDVLDLTKNSALVGFSLMSKDVKVVMPLVRRIREEQKKPVVWGGIHPTALPEESLENCDYVCIGEGEEPLRQLYVRMIDGGTDFSDIPNLCFVKGKSIVHTPATYMAESLDDLPFPDYVFKDSYFVQPVKHGARLVRIPTDPEAKQNFFDTDSFLFYSQRGCRFSCTYCSNSLYHGLASGAGKRWYRLASVDRIKRELRDHMNHLPFIRHVGVNDDDLLDRSIEELEQIGLFLKNELKVTFNINATPRHVTREKIEVLSNCGLRQIAMGVQTGSDRVLKHVYRRPVSASDVLRAARVICEFYCKGVTADYGFILDSPYEKSEDWRESLKLLASLPRPITVSLYTLGFFPGTELTKRALKEGMLPDPGGEFDKMYHDDIRPTYTYFMFLVNKHFDVPKWVNRILLSDFMFQSKFTLPFRVVLAMTTLLRRWIVKTKYVLKYVYVYMHAGSGKSLGNA